jgi:non-ribosomal peptide synthetase component F
VLARLQEQQSRLLDVQFIGLSEIKEEFEAQACRTPDTLAVAAGAHTVTYRELNERANRLARLLANRGTGPGSLAAVAMDRSVDLVVALVAVLKTGAGYVPMDPDYPADRLTYMVDFAEPVLLVTTASAAGRFTDATVCPRLLIDDVGVQAALNGLSAENLSDAERTGPVTLEAPSYVIYTSGSTGMPKAMVMAGRALVNLLHWYHDEVPGAVNDATAQFTGISQRWNACSTVVKGGITPGH